MNPLALLLVDDEPLARARLATLLRELPEPRCTVAGEAGNAAEALAWLERGGQCDALLLDIQMPGARGTELAARLRTRADAPAVVFVTAHADHALHAFELDAVDYLTKPVRAERLRAALRKVAQRRAASAADAPAGDAPTIVVSDRGRVVRVPVAEVLYLKAELKYVTLRTAAHSWVLDDALTDLERRLPAGAFLRIHRNALVARRAVRALERRAGADGDDEGWAVQVAATGEWLAVSRRQVSAVREALEAQ
jgi:two-component system response regulator AlgR